MSKILITGGAGFIGSHLTDALIAQGHQVSVVDNLYLGRLENIKHLQANPRFAFFNLDLRDQKKIKKLFLDEKSDWVYHLAANSDIQRGLANPDLDFSLNLQTTRSVLEAMVASNCKKIVFASTSAVYRPSPKALTEDHGPFLPISLYGATKLSAEAFISSYVNNFGLQAWIIRFANVVGPRATHGILLDFINKLRRNPKILQVLGDGEQLKPYIYVKDLIAAIEFFINHANDDLNWTNVGVVSRIKVKEVASIVAREMKLKPKIKYTGGSIGWAGDVSQYRYNLSKIHRLGWQAHFSSRQAVEKATREILKQIS